MEKTLVTVRRGCAPCPDTSARIVHHLGRLNLLLQHHSIELGDVVTIDLIAPAVEELLPVRLVLGGWKFGGLIEFHGLSSFVRWTVRLLQQTT